MSIELPADAEARAMNFYRLSPETKKQLIENVRSKPVQEQPKAIQTILRQSGVAAEFFRHILSKETGPMIRDNKKIIPFQMK